jgi:hypothetical protein
MKSISGVNLKKLLGNDNEQTANTSNVDSCNEALIKLAKKD